MSRFLTRIAARARAREIPLRPRQDVNEQLLPPAAARGATLMRLALKATADHGDNRRSRSASVAATLVPEQLAETSQRVPASPAGRAVESIIRTHDVERDETTRIITRESQSVEAREATTSTRERNAVPEPTALISRTPDEPGRSARRKPAEVEQIVVRETLVAPLTPSLGETRLREPVVESRAIENASQVLAPRPDVTTPVAPSATSLFANAEANITEAAIQRSRLDAIAQPASEVAPVVVRIGRIELTVAQPTTRAASIGQAPAAQSSSHPDLLAMYRWHAPRVGGS